ncbi:hypothetical protein ACIPLR_04930 [Herbaspirillum huttiense]|uniref:hypothetical protein n=1 Tax=Herbaspirillum huttiense TaxID=863372 RepID=UPI00380A9EFC
MSEAEKSLFAEFRQAKTEQAAARQQLVKAAKASKNHPDNSAAWMDENYVERTQRVKADAALAEQLLSAGEAWDVSVEISANRVSITYMPNEACISDRELVRKKGRWMITAIGSACD